MARIVVAIQGVLDPALDQCFYPPDLPRDWKLAYIANEFQACLLSCNELASFEFEPDERLPVDFRIYIEVDNDSVPDIPANIERNISGFYRGEENSSKGVLMSTSGIKESLAAVENLPLCHADSPIADLDCAFVSSQDISDLRRFRIRLQEWISETNEERVVFVAGGTNIDTVKRMEELVRLLS